MSPIARSVNAVSAAPRAYLGRRSEPRRPPGPPPPPAAERARGVHHDRRGRGQVVEEPGAPDRRGERQDQELVEGRHRALRGRVEEANRLHVVAEELEPRGGGAGRGGPGPQAAAPAPPARPRPR